MNGDKKNILKTERNGKKIVPISLINRALEELTCRASAGVKKQQKTYLDRLCGSLLEKNGQWTEVINAMLGKGISIKEIFEIYIPDSARQLGEGWVKNKLSFAEVTLATSRLQNIARELESSYIGSVNSGANGPEIMIISPKGEQHTFGAQMISRQLQRLGASPYLSINNGLNEIKRILSEHNFKLVGFSLSDYKLCDQGSEVRSTIDMIREFNTPIIVGGSLINSHRSKIKSLNVDMITNDAMHALRYFKLASPDRSKISDLMAS